MAKQTTHQTQSNPEKNPRRQPTAAGERDAAVNRNASHNYFWLLNCHISPYEHGSYSNHAAVRTRKLLVHSEEIRKLISKTQQKGLTLIPTRIYFKGGRVKVELALAKGKQQWDKRETERRRTADKEAREAIARSRKA
jgi:SsrA-binding protein